MSLAIKCDVPECTQCWPGPTVTGAFQELTAKQEMRALAESNGWYVARDRGAMNQNWDLCPGHAPPSGMRAQVSPTTFSLEVVGNSILMKKEKL